MTGKKKLWRIAPSPEREFAMTSGMQDPHVDIAMFCIYALYDSLDKLKLNIKRYDINFIFEFDSLDELRLFDSSYINNTRSEILEHLKPWR